MCMYVCMCVQKRGDGVVRTRDETSLNNNKKNSK